MNKIRIAIVDDQQLFRQGLVALINDFEELELVAEAENGKLFLEQLRKLDELPDLALIDMNMPEMNGVELNDILHSEFPAIKVIVLTVYDQERFISRMVDAGACGYLLKNCDSGELMTAIRSVHRTGFYLNNNTLRAMRNAAHYRNQDLRNINNIPIEISSREQEVLKLICRELTNAEIAEKLFISSRTVEGHRNNLLAKTGCRNTAGLVIFAIRHGIFDPGFNA
jgi:DNA-binding NarL/FixJ family response regulator